MLRLILLGGVAAAFFSSTFILNRAMSLAGGHWAWTAALRFLFMLAMLVGILLQRGGGRRIAVIAALYRAHWRFWTLAGGVGFGVFYALICYAASHAPGWIVAATWQTTILATPLVLLAMGRRVPARGLLLTALIFSGILLVNLEHAGQASPAEVLTGALPVLVAALAYPLGNQMVWEAWRGGRGWIPRIDAAIMEDSLARVLLLTAGSIPFWLLLLLAAEPPPPTAGQWLSTALVALLSGVIATAIFLQARHRCRHPHEIAAVDATQSMEVLFSLAGEVIFLDGAWPGVLGGGGIALILLGLAAYTRLQAAGGTGPIKR
jgi:drug/metabolite transporter (DMT)-like permease